VTRKPIRQLPPGLINRIAAGEVIERPASAVKECVENALDAGATRIVVEIVEGGRSLIRITDNGSGIRPDELALAFAAHATSKISHDDDLFAISTMGFRGEALASIGSVSFARIISRTPDDDSAYEITNRGGEVSTVKPLAGDCGTTIELRDLFFNVPARRRFLKGSSTEAGHVADAITRVALARPDVSFQLVSDGRKALDLPSCDPRSRWLEAWPESMRQSALDLDRRDDLIHIRGILGLPELAQPHSKHQHLLVNGRWVRDKFVGHALKEAYRGLTEPGRNPAAVLMLDLPPDSVDVNVHPTKSEVRFRDSSRIHGLVLSSIREVLLGNDLAPRAELRSVVSRDIEPVRDELREQLAAFFQAGSSTAPAGGRFVPEPIHQPSSEAGHPSGLREHGDVSVGASIISAVQIHNSYLVAESEDGLVIIDQHALHERIMFEELLKRVSNGPLESQRLLIPMTVPLSPGQIEHLPKLGPILERLGIEIDAIGPDGIAVHAFPSFLQRLDPVAFVKDAFDRADNDAALLDQESLLRDVLDLMACKAAVKAGDPLTQAEISALMEQRDRVTRSSNCPHGRPTTLKLTLRDLEKQFKRTGF
jgi:DNA mismatch repair protein MutL